jgi:phospholipid/cholesterol/gamma-HCH transport system substrate-binding protein
VTGASDDLRGFLAANGDDLIGLAASSRPTLATLARYSPEFPCLFGSLAHLVPRIDEAFGAGTAEPGLHVTLEVVANRGKYVPGEEPEYADDRGPRCYPTLPVGTQLAFRDGTSDADLPNSPGERRLLGELVALHDGTTPAAVPAWSSLLVGPLYRGTEVALR